MSIGFIYDIIKKVTNTEKSSRDLANNKYYFEIDKQATKKDVKKAIETAFGVEVQKINIQNYLGKIKKFKGREGTRKSTKKAIVTIKEGQTINYSKLEG